MTKAQVLKKYVKLKLSFPGFKKCLMPQSGEDAVFIGSPIHTNLGDHLIALEGIEYLKECGYSRIREIPEFVFELFAGSIEIGPDVPIVITGGGWLGDLYEDEMVFEDILTKWSGNRVFVLPQTVHFKNATSESVRRLRRALHAVSNLTFCVREESSFLFAQDALGLNGETAFLMPDMALLAMKVERSRESLEPGVVICSLRDDAEAIAGVSYAELKAMLGQRGYAASPSSTVIDGKVVRLADREKVISGKISEFASADLVVTDRLHSMIFALAAGTPCIALDNSTHKVHGVASCWLSDYPGLYMASDRSELALCLDRAISNMTKGLPPIDFSSAFEPLTRRLTA